ncbi:hypothetical protein [Amycolatopsis sp. PS_44_ISF1]|uniref:hypothetical protein n=1 Tax=Amycolatopsis sp. PS_44_ISF1 TaxID=2974917 RepID=UPI0028DF0E98|nr:hypothetical protein [Amycolatopsis sp. PS_44_ISF1]MDT8909568.1 hypothetical protein [Amycolatopsis sp. PS_44_ISF1]
MDADHRWGFEEAEDWEYESTRPGGTAADPADTLSGTDPDRIVEVVVTPGAEVRSVRLEADWRSSVDPRALQSSVLAAANAATMRALDNSVANSAPAPPPAPVAGTPDQSPLTAADVQRLVDSVSAELARFTERLSAVADRPAERESSGGHVSGSALRGQIQELTIDPLWAGSARPAEIESEVAQVLRALHSASTPSPDVVAGPQGDAISEVLRLVSDPQALVRRLGLPSRNGA